MKPNNDPRLPLEPRGPRDKRDLWGRRGPRKIWDRNDPEGPLDPWDLGGPPDPEDPRLKPEYWLKLFLKYLRNLARKIFNVVFLFTVFIFFFIFWHCWTAFKQTYHWIIIIKLKHQTYHWIIWITLKHQTYVWIIWILKHLWF